MKTDENDPSREKHLKSKTGIISFREEHASLQDIVGETEITSTLAGGSADNGIQGTDRSV